jgi:prolyl-tRNA editing enzyme YbaK/EbsC (Cys-tRNA(Pro) deacylase)
MGSTLTLRSTPNRRILCAQAALGAIPNIEDNAHMNDSCSSIDPSAAVTVDSIKTSASTTGDFTSNRQVAEGGRPPGELLNATRQGGPVITCKEAAAMRGVALKNELKTLVLETSAGPVAAHLRCDQVASLRAIKKILKTDRARLAHPEELRDRNLSRGAVCAILDPVWSFYHLIDRKVMALEFVTTNNGTTTGCFRFDPTILRLASSYTVVDFGIWKEIIQTT